MREYESGDSEMVYKFPIAVYGGESRRTCPCVADRLRGTVVD